MLAQGMVGFVKLQDGPVLVPSFHFFCQPLSVSHPLMPALAISPHRHCLNGLETVQHLLRRLPNDVTGVAVEGSAMIKLMFDVELLLEAEEPPHVRAG